MPRVPSTRLRSLRSIAPRVALFLTLGAATTLAVSFLIWLHPLYSIRAEARDLGAWLDPASNSWYTASQQFTALGLVESRIGRIVPTRVEPDAIIQTSHAILSPEPPEEYRIHRVTSCPLAINEHPTDDASWRERMTLGLPFGCISCAHDVALQGCLADTIAEIDCWHPPASWHVAQYNPLPTRIHPLPFVANTTLHAAALWALFLLPARLRQTLRKRKGHCPHCNYDLRATLPSQPCPECGHISGHQP
jgi:hypothetical protein